MFRNRDDLLHGQIVQRSHYRSYSIEVLTKIRKEEGMIFGTKMQKKSYHAFAKPETEEIMEVPYFSVVVEDKNLQLQEIQKQRLQKERQVLDSLKSSSVLWID